MNTSEVLNRAADLIEERGWKRGGMGWPMPDRPQMGLCLEGGIMAASGQTYLDVNFDDLWTCPAYRAVQAYLHLSEVMERHRPTDDYLQPAEPLWRWNDHQDDAEQVIATLRATALIEAAKENADNREPVTA